MSWESRPAELHRRPLAEPDVNLSAHPAPITQTAGEYAKFPVNEQVRMSTGIVVEAAPRPLPVPREFLGLSPHPLHKIPIEVSPQLAER